MISFMIDEIKRDDMEKIRMCLKKKNYKNPIKDLFWIQLPKKLLTPKQKDHFDTCGPYIFSLELGRDFMKLELLVRATNRIKCTCISFATQQQREYAINLVEEIYFSVINKKN